MRCWLLLLILVAFARPAAGSIEASWSACAPIVTDRVLPSGATASRLFFSATGLSGPVKAFQFQFSYGSRFSPNYTNCGAYAVPDAWRFEPNGCEGASLMQFRLTSNDAGCPQLTGANALTITNAKYDPLPGQMTILIAHAWQPAIPADPSTRYQLASVLFDHTYAVNGPGTPEQTCGGFEAPICFTLQGGTYDVHGNCAPSDGGLYVDDIGNTHSFGPYPNILATFRTDATSVACDGAVPATPTTWGALRAQYR